MQVDDVVYRYENELQWDAQNWLRDFIASEIKPQFFCATSLIINSFHPSHVRNFVFPLLQPQRHTDNKICKFITKYCLS